jgi:hypothetical protein
MRAASDITYTHFALSLIAIFDYGHLKIKSYMFYQGYIKLYVSLRDISLVLPCFKKCYTSNCIHFSNPKCEA